MSGIFDLQSHPHCLSECVPCPLSAVLKVITGIHMKTDAADVSALLVNIVLENFDLLLHACADRAQQRIFSLFFPVALAVLNSDCSASFLVLVSFSCSLCFFFM